MKGASARKSAGLARRKPLRTRRRSASEFKRIYGSRDRVRWIKSLPCIAAAHPYCAGPIENAHIKGDGMGRKADAAYIVPLCVAHHGRLHCFGARVFEQDLNLDMAMLADLTEQRWQRLRSEATPKNPTAAHLSDKERE